MSDEVRLEDRLGCVGYFGFGSGYALAKFGQAPDTAELYCSRACRRGATCWDRHRDRVRTLYPDLAALADDIAKTHKGQAYIEEWLKRTAQRTDRLVEPFTTVMMGNMEDGGCVAIGGRPKDRGDSTLAWPLAVLR